MEADLITETDNNIYTWVNDVLIPEPPPPPSKKYVEFLAD